MGRSIKFSFEKPKQNGRDIQLAWVGEYQQILQKITQSKTITTPVTEICLSWLMLNPLPLVSHVARHLLGKTAANHGLFCLLRHNPNRDSHLHFVDLNFELLQSR